MLGELTADGTRRSGRYHVRKSELLNDTDRRPSMRYPKAFFGLQIRFAEAASRLGDIPLERALLDYTNLYIRFGLGRAFDPYDSIWRDYTDGLRQATDISDWTYRFYSTRREHAASQITTAPFGCFSYVMPQCFIGSMGSRRPTWSPACNRSNRRTGSPAPGHPNDRDCRSR